MRLLREGDEQGPAGGATPGASDETTTEERRRLRCRVCETEVADPAWVFDASGDGVAVFVNPAGYAHQLITTRQATNVVTQGDPTLEFTWFEGYAWQHLLCANCLHHLGWVYRATGDQALGVFFGFRRSEISGA